MLIFRRCYTFLSNGNEQDFDFADWQPEACGKTKGRLTFRPLPIELSGK